MANVGQNTANPQDIRHIVNKNTQQRKRKKTIINLILLLLFLLLLIGVGFLTFYFVFNSALEVPKDIILDVNISAVEVQNGIENPTDYSRNIKFEQGQDSTTEPTKFERELPSNGFIKLEYKIINKFSNEYTYNIDFSQLKFDENCSVKYYTNLNTDEKELLEADKKVINFSTNESITITLLINVKNPELPTMCDGDILFTISVA